MTNPSLRPWPALAALALAVPAAAEEQRVVELAQLTIRERIIIRVPRLGPSALPAGRASMPAPTVAYTETKGPKCIAAGTMAGATIGTGNRVDLALVGGARVRAELDGDCAPLDFYSGFYLKGTADGMICAGRDSIRVRSGASCPIRRFRGLKVKR